MKKTLLAIGLMTLASIASAQSNVTIYGIMDAGMRHDSSANVAGDKKTAMVSGGQSASRLGFRGTEDLGGALTARFQLETGLNTTTGTGSQNGSTGTVLFDRFAYVGLGHKKFGEIQMGRNTTATFDLAAQGITDPLRQSIGDGPGAPVNVSNSTYGVSSMRINQVGMAVASTNGYRSSRSDSMIKYVNRIGDVGVTLGYAAGGNTGNDNKSSYTGAVTYKLGNLNTGVALFKAQDNAGKEMDVNSYGANYTVGKATLTAALHKVSTAAGFVPANLTTTSTATGPVLGLTTTSTPSTDATIKVLGVRYQVTNKLTSTLAYYDGDYKNGAGSQGTYKNYVFLNDYALSKRTNLYASLDQGRSNGALNQSNNGSNTGIMTGIRHLF